MKIDFKTAALLGIAILLALKGGDSPSPSSDDVLAAQQAGEAYLRGLADAVEELEPTDDASKLSAEMQEALKRVNNETIGQLNRRLFEGEYDPAKARRVLGDYSKGFRNAAK